MNIQKNVLFFISLTFFTPILLYSQEENLEDLLNLNLEELMNLEVITATKSVQKVNEIPATVRVITAEQIKANGYLTLEEALADLPGMQFRNIVGFNSYVFMRGVPSQNNTILLMVDGVLINELNSGGYYAGGQFNLSNVKAIEVVYGPASALYGTNALSGVINIITNDPGDFQGIEMSALYGNYRTGNVDFKIGHFNEKKDIGFILSGMYKYSEKADLREEAGDYNWTDQMENFETDLSFDGKMTLKNLRIGFVFQDKQASRTTNYKSKGTYYLDKNTNWHIHFLNGHVKYIYDKNAMWSSQSQLYYRNATVMENTVAYIQSITGPSGGQVGYYRPNNLVGFENQFNYHPIAKLQLIGGIVWEEEHLAEAFSKSYSEAPDLKPPRPSTPKMLTNHLGSLYIQAQYQLILNSEVTFGLRHDNSSVYGKIYTPRIGLVYSKNKLTTKGQYSVAFRSPKPWDYTFGIGNPDLSPETMRSVEASASYLLHDNLRMEINLYKNYIFDKLSNHVDQVVNGERLTTNGIETSIDYARKRFSSSFNYSYTASSFTNGEMVPEIGLHNANIRAYYNITPHFRLNMSGHYFGEKKNTKTIVSTSQDIVDDAFVLNLVFSYLDFNGFDFRLNIRNLLDTEYYHTSNRPPDRYRQPQRTIMFSVSYTL